MPRSLRSLRLALLLGGPLMSGCASILGDYELEGGTNAGGAGGTTSTGVLTNSGMFADVGSGFPFPSSGTQATNPSAGNFSSGSVSNLDDSDPCLSVTGLSVKDDFNDNMIGANWDIEPGDGNIKAVEVNGHLRITASETIGSRGGYQWKADPLSLKGCHILVAVNNVASMTGSVKTLFNLVAAADPDGTTSLISVEQSGSKIALSVIINGMGSSGSNSFEPGSMRWWRIREHDKLVSLDVSPDATVWSEVASSSSPFFISAVRPQLFVQTIGSGGFPATTTFDNFNTN